MNVVLAAAVTFQDIAPLIGAMLGGSILASLATWRKSGAERDSIAATATKTAIEVFESSIKQLKIDLGEAQIEAKGLALELAEARKEVVALASERSRLEGEVSFLQRRLEDLEHTVSKMPQNPSSDAH